MVRIPLARATWLLLPFVFVACEDPNATPTPTSIPIATPGLSQPTLVLDPASMDFGQALLGASLSALLTISNDGDGDLVLSGLGIEGGGGAFTLVEAFGATTLAGGESLAVTIAFTPGEVGVATASVVIESSDEGAVGQVPLSGEGVDADADDDGFDVGDDCDDDDAAVYPGAPEGTDSDGDGLLEGDGKDNDCDLTVDEGTDAFDDDGDGSTELQGDCDDADPGLHPGAAEGQDSDGDGVPDADGIDNNCDGVVDEGTDAFDDDGDGTTELEGDCDDAAPAVHPGATEGVDTNGDGTFEGDGLDNDCDGVVDEGTDAFDDDGDGTTELEGDCDDADAAIYPGAPEGSDTDGDGLLNGDGLDNDCDGLVDEGTADTDDDSDGASEAGGDCNDANPAIYPGAAEGLDSDGDGVLEGDGLDNDCDAQVDEGTDSVDDDGDGQTELRGDCDDTNAAIYAGAPEGSPAEGGGLNADGLDNNCNGQVDEGTLQVDDDGDGFSEVAGALPGGDCDDGNTNVYPEAPELGDGIDNDCDGETDEDPDPIDDDGDGYSEAQGDCNDTNPDIHPGASEGTDIDGDGTPEGDGKDNDCDGVVDDGTSAHDDDGDGFTELRGDCDDADPSVYPNAAEGVDSDGDGVLEADGKDNDCDGRVDEGTDLTDDDGDGYSEVEGETPGGDCNDRNPAIHPGAAEGQDFTGDGIPEGDGVDNDCDGAVDEGTSFADDDGDGYTELQGDCDDANAAVHPGAPEGVDTDSDGVLEGDGINNDCDGRTDEGTDAVDDDGDGLSELAGDCDDGDAAVRPGGVETCGDGVDGDCDGADLACDEADLDGDGYSELDGDCDDSDGDIYPGAPEGVDADSDGTPEGNLVDDDCDGRVDEGTEAYDDDGDGLSEAAGDCDDSDPTVRPGAQEGADADGDGTLDFNGVDDDCDGTVDEGTDAFDDDEDGFTEIEGDCDDADEDIYPDAPEADVFGDPNSVDDDCDTRVDEDFIEAADVIIAEVMVSPSASAGAYFEVFNTTDRQVDLVGWTVQSESGGTWSIPQSAVVPALDVLLVGASDVLEDNGGLSADLTLSGLGLGADDGLTLLAGAVSVNSLSWTDGGWPWGAGVAMTLDSAAQRKANNADAGLWCGAREPYGDGDLGTPGEVNGPCPNLDHDRDGYTIDDGDCDDFCDLIHPDAVEIIDTIDNNCDGDLAPGETPVEVALESAGFDDGDRAKITVQGRLVGTNGYGYNLVSMDPDTGAVVEARNFDTWRDAAAADAMAAYIGGLPSGQIVLLAVRADGTRYMNEAAYEAIEGLGSALVRTQAANDGFSLVGKVGLAPGEAAERHVARYSGTATAGCFRLATPVDVKVESSGYDDQNFTRFTVDGQVLSVPIYRGITLVVLDEYTGAVLDTESFDTHSTPSNSTYMAGFIRNLEPGRLVLVGIKDEGVSALNEQGLVALEGLGSGVIRQVGYRAGWALIGRKGSLPENVIGEAVAPSGSGTAVAENEQSCF